MSIWIFSIKGYSQLYRSLVKFCGFKLSSAQDLTYILNTANLDSFRYTNPNIFVKEMDETAFYNKLNTTLTEPYITEVQMYKSLTALSQNILLYALTKEQKEAYMKLILLMNNLEFWFYKCYSEDIDGAKTNYIKCSFGLETDESEPNRCFKSTSILV